MVSWWSVVPPPGLLVCCGLLPVVVVVLVVMVWYGTVWDLCWDQKMLVFVEAHFDSCGSAVFLLIAVFRGGSLPLLLR